MSAPSFLCGLHRRSRQVAAAARSICLAGVLALAAGQGALAQDLKIGYVNSERVMRESAPAKVAESRIEADFGKRSKDLNELAARLKSAADKLEKDAPMLTEAERNRRERELLEQDRDVQRRRREFQEDLSQRRNEEYAAVVEKANKVIKTIADGEKYDLIVQDAVFASPRVDITDKVIKALAGAK